MFCLTNSHSNRKTSAGLPDTRNQRLLLNSEPISPRCLRNWDLRRTDRHLILSFFSGSCHGNACLKMMSQFGALIVKPLYFGFKSWLANFWIMYRDWLKPVLQVWWISLLLLLITSTPACQIACSIHATRIIVFSQSLYALPYFAPNTTHNSISK